ncbi:hypothetical protein E4U21_000225 [Claviceps maximensis]|nr:hypothetical protein E4U21_000225 [Claviceps maximensis]
MKLITFLGFLAFSALSGCANASPIENRSPIVVPPPPQWCCVKFTGYNGRRVDAHYVPWVGHRYEAVSRAGCRWEIEQPTSGDCSLWTFTPDCSSLDNQQVTASVQPAEVCRNSN